MKRKDSFGDTVTCMRCLEVRPTAEMDRILWCEGCGRSVRATASRWGWGIGTLLAALLALWIKVVIQPSDIIVAGWIATIAAALWLSSRIAREVIFGVARIRDTRPVEAVPPAASSSPEDGPDSDR